MDNLRGSTADGIIKNLSENPPDMIDCYRQKISWSKILTALNEFIDKFRTVNEHDIDKLSHNNDKKKELQLNGDQNRNKKLPQSLEKITIQERIARDYQRELRKLCERSFCQIKMQDPCEICCCAPCVKQEEDACDGVPRIKRPPKCQCGRAMIKEKECCDACENSLKRI
ncbi:uncharacterized protein LOC130666634 [Microplitis mediator]|uniref:uncharacterized protein LOC130666634 n=1 Tax=Microplitis mediator TaxID=375433 RepID=UPI00255627C3|nr:uncharacterized protein LOC130666634 [Microplitis mediator]